ncbi:MAG: hypothetical protein WC372_11445 [Candidatus Neomarinimicrobiota bacterium]
MQLTPVDIEKNNTVQKCPICNGRGTILEQGGFRIPTKNPGRTRGFTQARLCICRKNEIVENSSSYFNPNSTHKVSTADAIKAASRCKYNTNIIFKGDVMKVLNFIKAVFVFHRQDSLLHFQIANGLEFLQNYYVEQKDGASRTLNDIINNRDLLVILANTRTPNQALAGTTLQIVQGRLMAGKGTWLYLPEDFTACTEYSKELVSLIDTWRVVDYSKKASVNKISLTASIAAATSDHIKPVIDNLKEGQG